MLEHARAQLCTYNCVAAAYKSNWRQARLTNWPAAFHCLKSCLEVQETSRIGIVVVREREFFSGCKALEIDQWAPPRLDIPNSPQIASRDELTRAALSFGGVLGFLRRAARYEPPEIPISTDPRCS